MITTVLRIKALQRLLEVNPLFTARVSSCSFKFSINCKKNKTFKLTSGTLMDWKKHYSTFHLSLTNVNKSSHRRYSRKKLLLKIL